MTVDFADSFLTLHREIYYPASMIEVTFSDKTRAAVAPALDKSNEYGFIQPDSPVLFAHVGKEVDCLPMSKGVIFRCVVTRRLA